MNTYHNSNAKCIRIHFHSFSFWFLDLSTIYLSKKRDGFSAVQIFFHPYWTFFSCKRHTFGGSQTKWVNNFHLNSNKLYANHNWPHLHWWCQQNKNRPHHNWCRFTQYSVHLNTDLLIILFAIFQAIAFTSILFTFPIDWFFNKCLLHFFLVDFLIDIVLKIEAKSKTRMTIKRREKSWKVIKMHTASAKGYFGFTVCWHIAMRLAARLCGVATANTFLCLLLALSLSFHTAIQSAFSILLWVRTTPDLFSICSKAPQMPHSIELRKFAVLLQKIPRFNTFFFANNEESIADFFRKLFFNAFFLFLLNSILNFGNNLS